MGKAASGQEQLHRERNSLIFKMLSHVKMNQKYISGQARWLTPVISALWADHLRSGIQDQPGQHGETPSLLKIQKLAGPVIPATQEAEVGESLEPRRQRLQ